MRDPNSVRGGHLAATAVAPSAMHSFPASRGRQQGSNRGRQPTTKKRAFFLLRRFSRLSRLLDLRGVVMLDRHVVDAPPAYGGLLTPVTY